jgi:hypothetical protein
LEAAQRPDRFAFNPALIVAWEIAARAVDSAFILPGPIAVLSTRSRSRNPKTSASMWPRPHDEVSSPSRSHLVSVSPSVSPAGASRSFDAALRPWMAVIKASPSFPSSYSPFYGSGLDRAIAVAALMAYP